MDKVLDLEKDWELLFEKFDHIPEAEREEYIKTWIIWLGRN
jgi:hypothetical protein